MSSTSSNTEHCAQLAHLAERVWQRRLDDEPMTRARLGLPVETLPDLSLDKARDRAHFGVDILTALSAISTAELSPVERLTKAVLQWQAEYYSLREEHFWFSPHLVAYRCPITDCHRILQRHEFREPSDAGRYLNLLDQYVERIKFLRYYTAERRAQGVCLPKPVLVDIRQRLVTFADAKRGPVRVAADRLTQLDDRQRQRFTAAIDRLFERAVRPALSALVDDLSADYEAEAPAEGGLCRLPGGDAYYRHVVRRHTSLDEAPEELHRIGQEECARLEDEMATLRAREFGGVDREVFHKSLRTDPRFREDDPDRLAERYRSFVKRLEPKLNGCFSSMPKEPYDVLRMDPLLESGMAYGYYQPPGRPGDTGFYRFNGSQRDDRLLIWAQALIHHELVPGHHFQIARQIADERLPLTRRHFILTAYTEGWAEYAADLAVEMGAYEDAYALYGRKLADLFASMRLMVDTGVNLYGWSRQRATKLLRDNLLESEATIRSEVLRYAISMPGQSMGYKIGSLALHDFRKRCRERSGAAFDIRDFHEAVLGAGAVPLAALGDHLDSAFPAQAH